MAGELRWGILSTASIGAALVKAVALHEGSRVQAVASRRQDRAGEWAREHGIPRAFGSYDAMLESGEIDAVYNPLPNSMHREWTIKALEAGLPVLCEKPLTVNANEARDVAAVSKRVGLPVAEAFMYRFHPVYARILELIADGEFGRIVGIRSAFSFNLADHSGIPWSRELAGGALMDVGCYCVNLSRLVTGCEPTRVAAVERRDTVDGTLVGFLDFPTGAIATFECSMEREGREFAQIEGSGGMIDLATPWFRGDEKPAFTLRRNGHEETIATPSAYAYHLEVADFVEAVQSGRPPRWPVEDAIANMTVIDALFQSAREKRVVDIEPA
jgi:D-xylose 1-dehydrogenase (NADP+, D-xylono-1,5-lactone-forming)